MIFASLTDSGGKSANTYGAPHASSGPSRTCSVAHGSTSRNIDAEEGESEAEVEGHVLDFSACRKVLEDGSQKMRPTDEQRKRRIRSKRQTASKRQKLANDS